MSRGALTIGAVGAVGVVVALGAAWLLVLRDEATPTSVADAVTSFREDTEPAPGAGGSPVPPGVYVYATTGFERTDALTGVTHRYPRRSTITVTAADCGVELRWAVLEGRSTTWTYCLEPGGWTLESQDERHTFFGRTERTTYTCAGTTFRPAGDPPGASFDVTCTTGSADERGTVLVVGREPLRVGNAPVQTVHLRKETVFTGEIRGTARHDVWLDRETGVPVRIVMESRTTNDSPVGDVNYDEEVTLDLVSLTPRR